MLHGFMLILRWFSLYTKFPCVLCSHVYPTFPSHVHTQRVIPVQNNVLSHERPRQSFRIFQNLE